MSFIHDHFVDTAEDVLPLGKGNSETVDFEIVKTGHSGEAEINSGYDKLDWDGFDAINPSVALKGENLEGSGFFKASPRVPRLPTTERATPARSISRTVPSRSTASR